MIEARVIPELPHRVKEASEKNQKTKIPTVHDLTDLKFGGRKLMANQGWERAAMRKQGWDTGEWAGDLWGLIQWVMKMPYNCTLDM